MSVWDWRGYTVGFGIVLGLEGVMTQYMLKGCEGHIVQ